MARLPELCERRCANGKHDFRCWGGLKPTTLGRYRDKGLVCDRGEVERRTSGVFPSGLIDTGQKDDQSASEIVCGKTETYPVLLPFDNRKNGGYKGLAARVCCSKLFDDFVVSLDEPCHLRKRDLNQRDRLESDEM